MLVALSTLEANHEPLNAAGWVFMLVSVGFVTILTWRCFRRVLGAPTEPPEQVKDFHSA